MIVGGYQLDLYCDGDEANHDYKEGAISLGGIDQSDANAQARAYGWSISDTYGLCLCEKCKAAGLTIRKLANERKENQ